MRPGALPPAPVTTAPLSPRAGRAQCRGLRRPRGRRWSERRRADATRAPKSSTRSIGTSMAFDAAGNVLLMQRLRPVLFRRANPGPAAARGAARWAPGMPKPGPDAASARCRPWNSAPGSFSGFLRGKAAPPKPSPVPRTAPVLQTAAERPAAGRRPRLEVPVPFTHLPLERRGLLGWNRSRFYRVCAHKTQVFRPAAFPFLSFFRGQSAARHRSSTCGGA